jgi:serine/threonine protein kinase
MASLDDFKRLEKIGEGTYGVVFKAYCKRTRQLVALKSVKHWYEDTGSIHLTAIRELSILKRLNHPNIVKMIDFFEDGMQLHIIFELLSMDLGKYMYGSMAGRRMDPTLIKFFCRQVTRTCETF